MRTLFFFFSRLKTLCCTLESDEIGPPPVQLLPDYSPRGFKFGFSRLSRVTVARAKTTAARVSTFLPEENTDQTERPINNGEATKRQNVMVLPWELTNSKT